MGEGERGRGVVKGVVHVRRRLVRMRGLARSVDRTRAASKPRSDKRGGGARKERGGELADGGKGRAWMVAEDGHHVRTTTHQKMILERCRFTQPAKRSPRRRRCRTQRRERSVFGRKREARDAILDPPSLPSPSPIRALWSGANGTCAECPCCALAKIIAARPPHDTRTHIPHPYVSHFDVRCVRIRHAQKSSSERQDPIRTYIGRDSRESEMAQGTNRICARCVPCNALESLASATPHARLDILGVHIVNTQRRVPRAQSTTPLDLR